MYGPSQKRYWRVSNVNTTTAPARKQKTKADSNTQAATGEKDTFKKTVTGAAYATGGGVGAVGGASALFGTHGALIGALGAGVAGAGIALAGDDGKVGTIVKSAASIGLLTVVAAGVGAVGALGEVKNSELLTDMAYAGGATGLAGVVGDLVGRGLTALTGHSGYQLTGTAIGATAGLFLGLAGGAHLEKPAPPSQQLGGDSKRVSGDL